MSRSKKASAAAPDAARLAARGLDPSEPKAALEILTPTWGEDVDLELWAVGAAGASSDPSVGDLLFGLQEKTSAKPVRREIKRALYKLEQRGLWAAPEGPTPPTARELLGEEEEAPQGWLSPIDHTGTRLAWMASRTAGGMASLSVVLNEDVGIREFHSGKATRSAIRDAHKEIAERSGIPLSEAPWEWVFALIREAYDVTERGRYPDVPRVLKAIAPEAPKKPAPPIDALLDRAEVARDDDALAASTELLQQKEVGTWLLPLPWMTDALEKVAESESSVVVLSPGAKEERTREALDGAVEEILDPADRRKRFHLRLEESAYLLAKRDAEPLARSALAASIATAEGRPISEIPVLAEITRRSLALAVQHRASKQAEEQKSSLVVTPDQAIAEERARRGR